MNYILTERGLTLLNTDRILSLHTDDNRWTKALELLKASAWDELVELLTPAVRLAKYISASGNLTAESGILRYKGEVLPNNMYMVTRALQHSAEGFPVDPLLQFIENLMQNSSWRAKQELLSFLEYGDLPITPDGYFLAYKRVRDSYFDVYTGKVLNKPADKMTSEEKLSLPVKTGVVTVGFMNGATTVSMARNQVDDRSEQTCSYGLHFCSREYLKSFSGERMIVLKINPRDVVSIPTDYNNTKGRCCQYQVVGELSSEYDPSRGNAWGDCVVDDYELESEFESGDIVLWNDQEVEIIDSNPNDPDCQYLVEHNNGERSCVETDELEALDTETPPKPFRFQIGDRVRVLANQNIFTSEEIGEVIGVRADRNKEDDGHVYEITDDFGNSEWVLELDLERE